MSETISFREMKLEGGWLMIRPEKEDLGKAMKLVRGRSGKRMDLNVKQHRNRRSLDANAYAWVLMGKLAEAMRISPVEVYREAIRNVGGNYEVLPVKQEAAEHFARIWQAKGLSWPVDDMGPSRIPGYRNLRCYYGSSAYDTQQMGQLIDNLVQDCRNLDIETLPPEKLSLLMENWDEKRHEGP